jgi:polyisoprenoid-binding protein YceI
MLLNGSRFRTFSVSVVSALFALSANASTYDVDASHSNVGFTIRHLVSKVSGSFGDYSASFSFDEKSPEKSSGAFTIKASSITTQNDKRDEHLRGEDFFDVKKFPEITFKSTKVAKTGKNKFKLSGDMTMHGVTKPVTFEMEYLGQAKDPWGNQRAGFEAMAKIKRKEFGLTWNKVLDAGGVMIGDDVELKLQIEAIMKAEATEKKG